MAVPSEHKNIEPFVEMAVKAGRTAEVTDNTTVNLVRNLEQKLSVSSTSSEQQPPISSIMHGNTDSAVTDIAYLKEFLKDLRHFRNEALPGLLEQHEARTSHQIR